jgi:hypothetical protein
MASREEHRLRRPRNMDGAVLGNRHRTGQLRTACEAAVTHPLDQPAAAGAAITGRRQEHHGPRAATAVVRSESARPLSGTVLRKVIAPQVTARREAIADRAPATSMAAVPNPTARQRRGPTAHPHRDPRNKAPRKAPRKVGVEAAGAGTRAAAVAIIVNNS